MTCPMPCSEFRLSWYTPVKEVPLCGHGTLAAAAAIIEGEEQNFTIKVLSNIHASELLKQHKQSFQPLSTHVTPYLQDI